MKFDLYLELASRSQNLSLLDLLRFPAIEMLHAGGEWSAKWWAHGKTRTARSTDREKIISKIAVEGCNELQIAWKAAGPGRSDEIPGINAVKRFIFNPSPTSDLWAAVPEEMLASRADERNRRSFLGAALIQTQAFRLPYPSIFECVLEIGIPKEGLTNVQLQAISINLIRSVLPQNLFKQTIFGYGCV